MSHDIPRLSGKEYLILGLVIAAGRPVYGLELVEMAGGELPKGTVYVVLARMEEKGYLQSTRQERQSTVSGITRRLYKPTGFGARVFKLSERLQALNALRPAVSQ